MSRAASNRQVFVVEDDDYDPSSMDNYSTRKRSQEDFYPKKQSAPMSVKDFPTFKSNATQSVSFFKTPKGIATIVIAACVGLLVVVGGLAGLMYYLGVTLNQRAVNATTPIDQLIDSTVLSTMEKQRLVNLGGFRTFNLLYRASRDGFFVNVFHRLCDNRVQTVSIIRTHVNSVFGGYTAQTWNQHGVWKTDATAFLFSLRRRGFANSERFNVTSTGNAIFARTDFGPTFGTGHDFMICENSDISQCSYTNFCSGYQCPTSFTTPNMHLGGVQTFNVTEIEVYQVTF